MSNEQNDASVNPERCVYSAIQQPAAMLEEGDVALNWREWKSSFDYYLIASGKENAPSKEKCALFLHVIGRFGREILEELDLCDKTKVDYEKLVQKFQSYCDPTRNINFERHVFFQTCQKEERFDKFLSNLKIKSKTCDFGSLRNSLILTQIIRGIKDAGMRERLLARHNIALEEAVSWCRAAETAGKQAEACAPTVRAAQAPGDGGAAELDALQRGPQRGPRRFQGPRQGPPMPHSACDKCGRRHAAYDKCSARNVKCYRCDRVGHFAKLCRAKSVHEVTDDYEEEDVSELLLYSLSVDTIASNYESWQEIITVENSKIKFKLDTGADVSVMSLEAFKEAGFHESLLHQDKVVLREISRSQLPVTGYFKPKLTYKGQSIHTKIYVLDVTCSNLLGLQACKELKLVARINELSKSSYNFDNTIFEGIGCLPNICKININENVPPVVNASRKIPIKLRPKLKEELDNMEKLNIIVKEELPTEWVSNIIIVEKPDKNIRLCLDPHHLNKAVRRCHFQLPTLDEITSNLTGAQYFSKLDAKKGFWMLRLDEASSKLCTFATPFGRYRFLRMPFGINCAPEIFHSEMYKIFSMAGVEDYCDDILVWGKTKLEHDSRLKEVVKRAKVNGVKFNKEKCVFGVSQINFLGHIFSSDGIKPDENRVKAIIAIPKPADKKELERFLGITNYLSRFIPDYSEISAQLRSLLKKDIEFEWNHEHDKIFMHLKKLITDAPVLRYYSPDEQVTLAVDASSRGLGACLLQGGRPVAYAARTLTPTESRWAQIEKELLAILFGCQRYHQFIYGHKDVIIESDHKPLEIIFKKSLNETPPRLQRMLLKLQAYSLQIIYKPGKKMFIADALSRAATERGPADEEVCDDVTVHVNAMFNNVEASSDKLDQIKLETSKDSQLLSVINYYNNRWPATKMETTSESRLYWPFRNEIHVVNGIVFRNNQIIIPSVLRKEMLKRIHEGHLGIEKCKRRARDVMWWPGMSSEIETLIQQCEPCQRHRAAPAREPLAPHPVPALPWEALAADVFDFKSKSYLLIVDYYSKFIEVMYLPNLKSETVIVKMKSVFARFGIPQKLVTDNATQFSSSSFNSFTQKWGINHVTSSPLYPRSNGLAERNVQTVKRLFTKASEDGTEWQLALLNFRNTPITGESFSPAQLLMGRALNTRLPVAPTVLAPKAIERKQMYPDRQKRIVQMKQQYDNGTRPLRKLQAGEAVRIRNGTVWDKATILNKADDDRSYWLKVDNGGGVYRRNRSHIMGLSNKYDGYIQNNGPPMPTCESGVAPPLGAASPTPLLAGSSVQQRPTSSSDVTTKSGRIVQKPQRYGFEI